MQMSIDAETFVSTATPTAQQRAWAFIALATVVLAYGALAPFFALPLERIPSFIPTSEGMTSIADLLTAVFLYSQFSITRSRAKLVLASGYVFAALVIAVRIATFPGAFSSTGLLGAGPQTASWLYVIWHFGFPVAIFSYVVLKDGRHFKDTIRSSAPNAICLSLMVVVGLVLTITWTVTARSSYLPQLVLDGIQLSPLVRYAAGFNLSVAVLTMLLLVIRQKSILD
jgi:uncharacterized membrane protein